MSKNSFPIEHTNILGVGVNAVDPDRTIDFVTEQIGNGSCAYIVTCTVYTVMRCYQDPMLRDQVNQASLVVPDGMPLVALSRWMGHNHVRRVYGPDLMLALSERSVQAGYSHFYYGGQPGVPEQLADTMTAAYPGLKIAGTYAPPVREIGGQEDEAVINRINASGADIVWVGLGSPKQDDWMARHRKALRAPVLIGVGAAFDMHTGRIPQAPKWMQKASLEWLFRLFAEPRRLWRRYLFYNPLFVWHMLLQLSGLKAYHMATDENRE